MFHNTRIRKGADGLDWKWKLPIILYPKAVRGKLPWIFYKLDKVRSSPWKRSAFDLVQSQYSTTFPTVKLRLTTYGTPVLFNADILMMGLYYRPINTYRIETFIHLGYFFLFGFIFGLILLALTKRSSDTDNDSFPNPHLTITHISKSPCFIILHTSISFKLFSLSLKITWTMVNVM